MKELWSLASFHTPSEKNADIPQAIMDIGATVCTPKNPYVAIVQSQAAVKHSSTMNSYFSTEKNKKSPKPEKKLVFLIYINEKNEVFLIKRPGSGIWGGLWCFESVKTSRTID